MKERNRKWFQLFHFQLALSFYLHPHQWLCKSPPTEPLQKFRTIKNSYLVVKKPTRFQEKQTNKITHTHKKTTTTKPPQFLQLLSLGLVLVFLFLFGIPSPKPPITFTTGLYRVASGSWEKKILFSNVSISSLTVANRSSVHKSQHAPKGEQILKPTTVFTHCLILSSFTPIYWPHGERFWHASVQVRGESGPWDKNREFDILFCWQKSERGIRVTQVDSWCLLKSQQHRIGWDPCSKLNHPYLTIPYLCHRLASHTFSPSTCTSQKYR